MSKKFKKLICGILSAAMVLGSMSIVGFADADSETTDAEEVTATATPAPTAAPDLYESDEYYQKSLALCQSLGIITGYEDGDVQPDKVVTRAEMATIVLRASNIPTAGSYQEGLYSDVTASHWASGTIQNASDQKIINGFDDGTFQPDGEVTATQVQKMLVCAANFGLEAEYNGGYPGGYLKVANDRMSLNKGVTVSDMNAGLERGNVIKMVYNALMAPFNEIVSAGATETNYDASRTWAKVVFDITEERGILEATNTATINTNIKPTKNQISIDGTTFYYEGANIDSIVGSSVTYYYRDVNGTTTVLAVVTDNVNTKTETLDVEDIEELSGFENGTGTIKMDSSSKTYKMSDTSRVIYNGSEITYGLFTAASSDTTRVPAGTTYDDFLLPDAGTIKLVDNDNDARYDIMYVDSYETVQVVSATDRKVVAKTKAYNADGTVTAQYSVTINVDTDADPDKVVKVTRAGAEVNPRNLRADDVASVKRSIDESSVEIVVTGESITGSVKSITTDSNKNKVAVVNGTEYVVAAIAYDDINVATEGTFFLDAYERIGYVEASNTGGLISSEKYGWVINAYQDESGTASYIRMYTSDNTAVDMKIADSNVNFWGKDMSAPAVMTGTAVFDAITKEENGLKVLDPSKFLSTSDNIASIRLVKYKTNSKDELSQLYCAVSSKDDESALVVDPTKYYEYTCRGSVVEDAGYSLTDGMTLVQAPMSETDMKDAANYNITTTNASAFLHSSKTVNRHVVFAQFQDGNFPQLIIEYLTTTSSSAPTFGDYDHADESGHPMFIVNSVSTGIDEDDNTVYTISGYSSGSSVQYTTRSNSSLYSLDAGGFFTASTELWNALKNSDSIGNYIKKGDVLLVHNNGEMFVRIASIDALIQYAKTGNAGSKQIFGNMSGSNTREMIQVGHIIANETGVQDLIQVGTASSNASVVMSTGAYFDLVTITEDGSVFYEEEGTTMAELSDYTGNYDGTIGYGDLALVYSIPKGRGSSVVIFRFGE